MATATTKAPKTAKKAAPKAAAKTASAPAGSFSVIQTGGKQYMVSEGSVLKIEAMKGELTKEGRKPFAVGDKLTFGEVLLSDNGTDATTIGMPFIE
ncbi:MAG: bL21 family ribosomal protein, partial [Armatimonadetes bacterium]|nr:bL21 family ribosomal protein [Armatimonadota bacterium]